MWFVEHILYLLAIVQLINLTQKTFDLNRTKMKCELLTKQFVLFIRFWILILTFVYAGWGRIEFLRTGFQLGNPASMMMTWWKWIRQTCFPILVFTPRNNSMIAPKVPSTSDPASNATMFTSLALGLTLVWFCLECMHKRWLMALTGPTAYVK